MRRTRPVSRCWRAGHDGGSRRRAPRGLNAGAGGARRSGALLRCRCGGRGAGAGDGRGRGRGRGRPRRRVRQRGHRLRPRLRRRRRPAARDRRERRLEPRPARQPRRRPLHDEARSSGDEAPGIGTDRRHVVERRAARGAGGLLRLRGGQGRDRQRRPPGGSRAGSARHPRQRDLSRPLQGDEDRRRSDGEPDPGARAHVDADGPSRAHGQSGGAEGARAAARLPGFELHDGRRVSRRRRHDGPGRMTLTQGQVVWAASEQVRRESQLGRYQHWLRGERGLDLPAYEELFGWSVSYLEGFSSSVWDYFGVRAHAPYERVLGSREMPGAEWFPGATLNFAEHMLGRDEDAGSVAIVARSQSRGPVELTFGELGEQVARARAGLERLGVGPGDRVVAYLPNIPETLVAFLASASIGAVWATCPPEFGVRGVLDRLGQLDPKVLLAVAGYRWGEKHVDRREQVAAVRERLP